VARGIEPEPLVQALQALERGLGLGEADGGVVALAGARLELGDPPARLGQPGRRRVVVGLEGPELVLRAPSAPRPRR
jgi:hypothetical protein